MLGLDRKLPKVTPSVRIGRWRPWGEHRLGTTFCYQEPQPFATDATEPDIPPSRIPGNCATIFLEVELRVGGDFVANRLPLLGIFSPVSGLARTIHFVPGLPRNIETWLLGALTPEYLFLRHFALQFPGTDSQVPPVPGNVLSGTHLFPGTGTLYS